MESNNYPPVIEQQYQQFVVMPPQVQAQPSEQQHEALVNKLVKKQSRLNKVQNRLGFCSKALAGVAVIGIAGSVFPFIVGAPDFMRPPPEWDHHGPPRPEHRWEGN